MRIEGVFYSIDWKNFTIGSSFFIPCIRDKEARELIERKMKRLGFRVVIKLVIEDGIRGLRVWRVDRYNRFVVALSVTPPN